MFKYALLATALLAAAPAIAGTDQLARSVGVDPGVYSPEQLASLAAMQHDDSNKRHIEAILADPQGNALTAHLSTTSWTSDE